MSAPGRTPAGFGRSGFSLGVRFVLLAIVCVALMMLDQRQQHLQRVRQALSVVVYPVRVLVDLPFRTWQSARVNLTERSQLIAENEQLKRERLEAEFRLQRLAALETENTRLRQLLDSTERVGLRALVAEILSVDMNPYRQRFVLNRGLSDGVFVGQALIDAQGIVGQIVRVDAFTAEAVLITDADTAVPVSVNREKGLRTIAVGTGDSARLRLPYLTNSADIKIGDPLVSSGLGGVFPAGYPVGRVVEVKLQPDQSFSEVIAEPASALDRDREVLLVWNDQAAPGDPKAKPAAKPAAATAAAPAGAKVADAH
jgi:rod shape-determining protein MreC